MGRRDRLKALVRRAWGGGREASAPLTPAPAPVPAEPALPSARLGDLWAVRAVLEPTGRPMVVNHWATWCEGCVEELDRLAALNRRWRDRVSFTGIGWELFSSAEEPARAVASVARMSDEAGLGYTTVVFDGAPEDLFVGLELAEHQIPQTFVVDGDGVVRWHHLGALGAAEVAGLEAVLEGLLRLEQPPRTA